MNVSKIEFEHCKQENDNFVNKYHEKVNEKKLSMEKSFICR